MGLEKRRDVGTRERCGRKCSTVSKSVDGRRVTSRYFFILTSLVSGYLCSYFNIMFAF